jgi:UDPglucose 6-dehydrogenase
MRNVTVVGAGYVGLSLSVVLSKNNNVIAVDTNKSIVDMINSGVSHLDEADIQSCMDNNDLNLTATTSNDSYKKADFIIVATPTDYDEQTSKFNTSTLDSVIADCVKCGTNATIVIKSTIPVGYTESIKSKTNYKNIMFSPEFLREGQSINDNLNPSRIIIGDKTPEATDFVRMLIDSSNVADCEKLYTGNNEAESIKLFLNTYLATRVSFFNELDTYCEVKGIKTDDVIAGLSLDYRVGNMYNNPSFGYGGYCLPKDSKQLASSYKDIPNDLIKSVVRSNKTRKEHICNQVLSSNPKKVGVYRLAMKHGSDNFRSTALEDIIETLSNKVDVLIYEPKCIGDTYKSCLVTKNINDLDSCDIVIANRNSDELDFIKGKVYTRDVSNTD